MQRPWRCRSTRRRLGSASADYADAFEVRLREPDGRTAEEWIRAGLEGAPAALRWTIVVVHRTC